MADQDRRGPGTPWSPPPERPLFRDEVVPARPEESPTLVQRPVKPFPPTQATPTAGAGDDPPPPRPPRENPAPLAAYPPPPPPPAPAGMGGGPSEPPVSARLDSSAAPRRRFRRFSRRRVLITALVLLLVLPTALYFFADSRLERINAFPPDNTRPASTPGSDWLIVGSDSREGLSKKQRQELATGKAGGQRADTMMLLHIPDSGGGPTLVSLPRDLLVPIPGRSQNRLNAAFSFGGAPLLVRTVEAFTQIRIDHYAEIGFGGLFDLVNAVGGVELCIKEARKDPKAGLDIKKGCQNLDGGEALGYARSRASTRGDFDRVDQQRQIVGALMDKVASPMTVLNPLRAWSLATKGTGALSIDDGDHLIDLVRLAWAAKSLDSDGTTTTVPIGREFTASGVGSVVSSDPARATAMFTALRQDRQVPKSALMQ
ncbi:MAG: LCP family protein [Sporichthyaceae bacterium]